MPSVLLDNENEYQMVVSISNSNAACIHASNSNRQHVSHYMYAQEMFLSVTKAAVLVLSEVQAGEFWRFMLMYL